MATIYLRGRVWWLNDKGQRRSLDTTSEAEAKAALLAHERAGIQSAAGPCFAEWALEYSEWHSREYPDSYFRIEQILRCHLIPKFGPLPIGGITRQDVERYKQERKASPATVTKELRTLQAALNKAVEWEVIPVNRSRGVKPPKGLGSRPPRFYTAEEMRVIYAHDSIHRWTWQLLANTGLRRSEALHLRWRDVGEETIRVVSEPAARTKSARWRLVPITVGAREALSQLRRGDFVLPQVHEVTLTKAFKKVLRRVNLDGNLHCLRHTYGSHLVMAGVPLKAVQTLMGHSTIKVTEQYAHLAHDYLVQSAALLAL